MASGKKVKKATAKKAAAKKAVAKKAVLNKPASKSVATKKAVVKAASKKPVVRKSAAKRPSSPGPRASIVATRATTGVRDDVLAVVAQVSGKDESEVAGNSLSKLAFPCNSTFTDRIAFQLNAQWSELNPRFGPADVACSDTVDSLTREVETRLG